MHSRIITLLLVFSSTFSFAGGFQVNLQGQKQTGMGHTGVGLLSDASTVLFNPGGISLLDSSFRFSVGGSFIFPRVTYLAPYPGNYSAETVHNTGTPFSLYAAWKIKKCEKLSVALGVYTPFGSKQQWEDDWIGQFLIREIDLKTIFIQPSVSYKINERLGVGVGFVYATGSFGLRKGVPVQDSTETYGEGKLDGKASGMGFNFGVYFRPNEKLSIGLDYRSSVKVSVDGGEAQFTVPTSLQEYFPTTMFSTTIKLPSVITLGVGYTCKGLVGNNSNGLRLALDINYIGWSSYDSLVIDFADNTEKLADIHSARKYKNSFIFRMGGEYGINNLITVRAGTYYDMTPVQDGYLTPETPDTDKIGITGGLSIRPTKFMSIDLSFLFIEGKQRYDKNIETEFEGTYKSRAIIPGIGFEFIF